MNSQKTKSTNLPPGQYTLVVIGTSRAIIRDIQKIEIKPGEASAIQIPPMANVTVTATPSNCKVFIDGIFVDIPPIFDLPVQAGNHEIKVVWEKQQKEKVSSFALAAGEKSTVRAVILNDSPDVFQEGK